MSKIGYCTLEEAWQTYTPSLNLPPVQQQQQQPAMTTTYSMNKNNNLKIDREEILNNINEVERKMKAGNNNTSNNNSKYDMYRINTNNSVSSQNANTSLKNTSNWNLNSNVNSNVVNNDESNNSDAYTPFEDSIERKYLQDKLFFLENELRRYKNILMPNQQNSYNNQQRQLNMINNIDNDNINNYDEQHNVTESFGNFFGNNAGNWNNNPRTENFNIGGVTINNDMIDLIILIIIGLLIIFVFDSIFKIGKSVGSRGKIF